MADNDYLKGTPRIPNNRVRSVNAIQQDEHCDLADAKRVKLVDEAGDAINTGNPLPVDAIINLSATKPDVPEIFAVAVATANTEVSQVLPATTEKFTIKLRERKNRAVTIRYSWISGETVLPAGTNYFSIDPGDSRTVDGLSFDLSKTIYISLSSVKVGGDIVEIETWRNTP